MTDTEHPNDGQRRVEVRDTGSTDGPVVTHEVFADGYTGETIDEWVGNVHMLTGDHYVVVGPMLVPEWVEVTFEGDVSTPDLFVRMEIRNGSPEMVDLRLSAHEVGGVLRQKDIDLKISDWFVFFSGLGFVAIEDEDGTIAIEPVGTREGSLDVLLEGRRRRNRQVTPELLQEVAVVYRDNIGDAPTQAVRSHFNVGERRASKYVQLAREAGFLPATKPGKKKA